MINRMKPGYLLPVISTLLVGCGATQYEFDVDRHITKETVAQEQPFEPSGVPDLVSSSSELPQLQYEGNTDVFDIVVENVSVRKVILSLADQAQLDLDVDPRVQGVISLNAYGQTLPQILERIRKQLPVRYERVGTTLVMMNDDLYYKQYFLHFPDLTRSYSADADGSVASSGSGSLGSSSISITKDGSGSVWEDLEGAIEAMLLSDFNTFEFDIAGPVPFDDSSTQLGEQVTELVNRQAKKTIVEPFSYTLRDAGLIIVYASTEQHQIIGEVIAKVSVASRRQVLLQATVVEIALNNKYQQGIDWSIFNNANQGPKLIQSASILNGPIFPAATGIDAIEQIIELLEVNGITNPSQAQIAAQQALVENRLIPPPSSSGGFLSGQFAVGDLQAAVTLLDQFGDTKVVSSPRVSTLNGQAAILKVVEDRIYFSVKTTTETDAETNITTTEVDVEEQTVPVGFVVNVYPQIGADGTIFLAMRPSVSRVIGTALSPASEVGSSGVPIISVKEIETLMLLNDGQTAVMGGMIEDVETDNTVGIPGVNKLPGIGNFFNNIKQEVRRVEYVIFVSAHIIKNPSLHGDYSDYKKWLPSDETFHRDNSGNFLGYEVEKVSRAK